MSETKPKGPFAADSVAWEHWSEGERFGSKVRVLSNTRDGPKPMKIGVSIEEVPPGKQSCPFHFHMIEEEHMYFLEGTATLRLGEERFTVKAGDFVSFPAGEKHGHCLINESDAPVRFIMIGDNSPDEVCVYPDSNKVSVSSLRRIGMERILDAGAVKDYWDGEK